MPLPDQQLLPKDKLDETHKSSSVSIDIDVPVVKLNINEALNDGQKKPTFTQQSTEQDSTGSQQQDRHLNNNISENTRLRAGDSRNNRENNDRYDFDFTYSEEFSSKELRVSFIKCVYGILSLMLSIVFGQIIVFKFAPEANSFIKKYEYAIILPSVFLLMVCTYAISCYEYVRRKVPLNFIVLTILSITLGLISSSITIKYESKIIMLALFYTLGITLAITILAACCPIDITKFGLLIFIMSTIVLILSLITWIVLVLVYKEFKMADIILGTVGVLIFSIYLAYDTQIILGGRKYQVSSTEYIFAVTVLLFDIVNIFLYLLRLLGGLDD